jgi:transcription termination factor Rho
VIGREDGQGRRRRGQGRRGRGRAPGREPGAERGPAPPVTAEGTTSGWFDLGRDGGFVRLAENSYLPDPGDAFIPTHVLRQLGLRRGDLIEATIGRDHRGRTVVIEVQTINGTAPAEVGRRPDFQTLTASYPERQLYLETGRPAKGGPELTRRAVDLIAPIGYGQRALIVAPARAGKTMLLQAIVEGVAVNHPETVLFVLLVDERPEEVSEMITWGYGEVVASSFDMPAERHTQVADMVLERSRRLVELGKNVVIVLDSITRLARAHNTVDRGTGRTLSGGLDAQAMARPKAFFGSARAVMDGGSLTIVATALVETGSRMDDVIFEEFKGTGNSELKLDRSLAERRIFPAIDIATSGTRREEKLFRPDQLDAVHTLRRGLHQMPPQSAMEWLIKRIAATPNNDALLDGL